MYCDRNICLSNDYNNIDCDGCVVTKSQEEADQEKDVAVGCEIEYETCHGLITMITSDQLCILWEAGDVGIIDRSDNYTLTGRKFDISPLLDFLNDYD